jgi:hypothetical protein
MRRTRWALLVAGLMVAVIGSWLWWSRPQSVDMATYAPADSLLYLEANRPLAVFETIAETDAWKTFERVAGNQRGVLGSPWLQRFIGWTGIGPVQSVVLARAQIAAVVTDLGATEEGETLRIKPEGAILIETHTAEFRIRPQFEKALGALAQKTYGRPTQRQFTLDGVAFTEWKAPDGSRQIVGTIVGSLIIVGNSERAVQNCAEVALGKRPKLKDDPELNRMRLQLAGAEALTFGYVPPGNSARLLAVGVPLLLGRAPGDAQFQRLVTTGAAKVFGSLSWTSKAYSTGIEDRYLITLQPSIVSRLEAGFRPTSVPSRMERVLPEDFYSVTSYKFANLSEALQSLRSAVSSQVDALSAIVFSSLLKSALMSYGIDDPENFLGAVNGELLTLRLDENSERALLIAGVKDRAALRDLVTKKMHAIPRSGSLQQPETFEDSEGEFAAGFMSEYVVVGSPPDVRRFTENSLTNATGLSSEKLRRLTFFVSKANSANVVTYTNDRDRVRTFISAVLEARGMPMVGPGQLEEAVANLPYSVTETSLGDRGFERVTRSPLGQFSTIFPLLFPEKPRTDKNSAEPR